MAKRKIRRTNRNKLLNNSNGLQKKQDVINEAFFVTSSGKSIKIFPVDSLVLSAEKVKLEKQYKEDGYELEPPVVKKESAPGATDVETILDNEDICIVKDNEEETERRLKLYAEWKDVYDTFQSELNNSVVMATLVWGLGSVDYYGDKQEGGLDIPDNFKDIVEKLGHDWPNDYFTQMSYYLQSRILKTASDLYSCYGYISQLAQGVGMLTHDEFEEAKQALDAQFRRSSG
jgi:hypothetical protein